MARGRNGDVVHWTSVWNTPIDVWAIIINDKDGEVCVIHGSATARHAGSSPISWGVGSTTHIMGDSKKGNIKVRVVPPGQWPAEVCVAVARRALLSDFTKS